jgi:hypothetical protein
MLDLKSGCCCERPDAVEWLNLDDPKSGASETSSSSSSVLVMLSSRFSPYLDCSDCANMALDDAGPEGKPGPAFDFGGAGVPLAVRGGNCLEPLA